MGHTPEGIAAIIAAKTTWAPMHDELLIKLWGEGKSASQIAERIGKTRNAVIGRAHRLRHAGKDLPERPREPGQPRKPRPQRRPREAVIVLIKPKPLPPLADTLEGSVPFEERTGCKWPVTPHSPHRFCNKAAMERSPYCEGHAVRAYQPREMRRGRHEVPFQ